LTKKFQDELPDCRLKDVLAMGQFFLQVGAVTPDLPYASIADKDLFFTKQTHLADDFHYKKTNEIPLKVWPLLKDASLTDDERYYAFSFFLGYCSHVVADSIVHPFVRDMVGNYQGNETEHRRLEMKMDVLFYNDYMGGIELKYSDLHDELKNIGDRKETKKIITILKDLIIEVYGKTFTVKKIMGWLGGLHLLFDIALNPHLRIFRHFDAFLYHNADDLLADKEKTLLLTDAVGREKNFLNGKSVHFLKDCVPRYYKTFIPTANKAYEYVYNNGPEVTDKDLPATNLDTGRLLPDGDNLDLMPVYWEGC